MSHSSSHPELAPLRQASREVVRELGFLQSHYSAAQVPHTHYHALLELERWGPLSQQELSQKLVLDKSTISRLMQKLRQQKWVQIQTDPQDKRSHRVLLTEQGKSCLQEVHNSANQRVSAALETLNPEQRQTVLAGFQLYAKALQRSRRLEGLKLEAIAPEHNPSVARLIRQVMPEFGAGGPGFAIHDPEVDAMYETYTQPRSCYFVITRQDSTEVLGGGGIAPLAGGAPETCELRKMYFLPELRGLGLGQMLIERCLDAARAQGFRYCYLETLEAMQQARALYHKNGFEPLSGPLGQTGHFGCDRWMLKKLLS